MPGTASQYASGMRTGTLPPNVPASTVRPEYRPQSAQSPRIAPPMPYRPQSAPNLPKPAAPRVVSRAEEREIADRLYSRGPEYKARRLKKVEDHIASLNAMKHRTQLRPAGYKYMSEESKAAYDAFKQGGHPDVYKEGDKIWRKNFATKEQQIEATKFFYYEAKGIKDTKIKAANDRAKRKIDGSRLCNFTALDKDTRHQLLMKRDARGNVLCPTIATVYGPPIGSTDIYSLNPEAWEDLVRQDRARPMAKIWSLVM